MWWGNHTLRREGAGGLPVCLWDTWSITVCVLFDQLPSFGPCYHQHPKAFRNCESHSGPETPGVEQTPSKHEPLRQEAAAWTHRTKPGSTCHLFIYFQHGPNVNVCLSHKMSHSHWIWPRWNGRNKSNYTNSHLNKADTKVLCIVGQSTI